MGNKPDGEKPEKTDPAPKRKRAGPTIELKASNVLDKAPAAGADMPAASASASDTSGSLHGSAMPAPDAIARGPATNVPTPNPSAAKSSPIEASSMKADSVQPEPVVEPGQSNTEASSTPPRSSFGAALLIVPAVIAVAAAVVAILWVTSFSTRTAPGAGASSASSQTVTDALAARVSKLEARSAAAPSSSAANDTAPSSVNAADAGLTARVDALEKSIASLREAVESSRAETEKIATGVEDVKKAQADTPPPPDLAPLSDRIAQLEKATVSLTAQAATPPPPTAPPENPKIRTAVAATALDSAVRQGEPYTVMLSNVAATMDNSAALKPLEPFAAGGVPSAKSLCGELLALIAKADVKADAGPPSGDMLDRLRASASKLVRIERTDSPTAERTSVLTRIAAAAGRDDLAESRREVMALSASDRAPFQAWLDKAAARDAALNASRQFASDAMLSLSSSAR